MNAAAAVLCAIDFSDWALEAALRAALVAEALGAPLELVHVLEREAIPARRGARIATVAAHAEGECLLELDRIAAAIARPRLSVSTALVKGSAVAAILDAAAKARLVVLGSRGQASWRESLVGSTADRVIEAAQRPVLVVRRSRNGPYSRVLLPVDFSAISESSLAAALRAAPQAKVLLLHAYNVEFERMLWRSGVDHDRVNDYRVLARTEAVARLRTLAGTASGDMARFEQVAKRGHPHRVIVDTASDRAIDLIVMGKQRRSLVERLMLDSVVSQVLADAPCDVLVLPAGSSL